MSLGSLPYNIVLHIFGFLPFEDRLQFRVLSQKFDTISTVAISRTTTLNLYQQRFQKLESNGLRRLLNTCKKNLKKIRFSKRGLAMSTQWNEKLSSFAETLSEFACRKLVEINFGAGIIRDNDSRSGDNGDDSGLGLSVVEDESEDEIQATDDHQDELAFAIQGALFSTLIRQFPTLRVFIGRLTPDFGLPPDVVGDQIARLELFNCSDSAFRSLGGRFPNLQHFACRMRERTPGRVIDDFVASVPNLQLLDLGLNNTYKGELIRFEDLTHFWGLSALKSLSITAEKTGDESSVFRPFQFDDVMLKKISASFPQLQRLELEFLRVRSEGYEALASLSQLRFCYLRDNAMNMSDRGAIKLVNCYSLTKFCVHSLVLKPTAFVALVRSCPELRLLMVGSVADTHSPETVVEILRSVEDIGARKLKVVFNFCYNWETWNSELVSSEMKNLREAGGPTIEFLDDTDFVLDSNDHLE